MDVRSPWPGALSACTDEHNLLASNMEGVGRASLRSLTGKGLPLYTLMQGSSLVLESVNGA